MTTKKSTIHQYVRVVTTPLTKRDLILLVYQYWPKCSKIFSPTVWHTILPKIAVHMVPPVQNLEQLKGDILKIWKNRKYILQDNSLYNTLETRVCLTDDQEELLTQIYQTFPKRIKMLTYDVLIFLSHRLGRFTNDIREVWQQRYKALNGRERYSKWKKQAKITLFERKKIDTICRHWPKFKNGKWATRLTPHVLDQLIVKTRYSSSEIKSAWSLRKYMNGVPDFYSYETRICAAVAIQNMDLVQYYIDQGDDINEFGGFDCPLMLAIRKKNQVIINFLLEQPNINVNAQASDTHQTPLIAAGVTGNVPIMNLLLSKGANPNQTGGRRQVTAFWWLLYMYEDTEYEFETLTSIFPTTEEAIQKTSIKSHWEDGEQNILMIACRSHSNLIRPVWEASHPFIDINSKSQFSNTALHFAVKNAEDKDIEFLLNVTGIDVNIPNKHNLTPLDNLQQDRSHIQDLLLSKHAKNGGGKQIMSDHFEIMERLVKEQVAREVPRSASPGEAPLMFNHHDCLKFSLNQGEVGICYMVSIITLFRNEFSILRKLEECIIDEDIYNAQHKIGSSTQYAIVNQMADFLSKDYSSYNFENYCPTLPKSWQKSVYETDEVTRESVVNSGNPTLLLLYILQTIQTWKPDVFQVYFGYIDQADDTFGNLGHLEFQKIYQTFETSDQNLAMVYISFEENYGKTHYRLDEQLMSDFERLYRKPYIRGFVIRTAGDNTNGHVFAATICEDQVYYCNSWGNGCVGKIDLTSELLNKDVTARITHVYVLLRK
jgi:ankyrin repeat protein